MLPANMHTLLHKLSLAWVLLSVPSVVTAAESHGSHDDNSAQVLSCNCCQWLLLNKSMLAAVE
jgi:hypothetical protein